MFIDRIDWGAGHMTIIVGTGGGAFANKSCPQGRAFEQFFKCPGVCPGGMLAAGIDSHIRLIILFFVYLSVVFILFVAAVVFCDGSGPYGGVPAGPQRGNMPTHAL